MQEEQEENLEMEVDSLSSDNEIEEQNGHEEIPVIQKLRTLVSCWKNKLVRILYT